MGKWGGGSRESASLGCGCRRRACVRVSSRCSVRPPCASPSPSRAALAGSRRADPPRPEAVPQPLAREDRPPTDDDECRDLHGAEGRADECAEKVAGLEAERGGGLERGDEGEGADGEDEGEEGEVALERGVERGHGLEYCRVCACSAR